MLFFPLRSRSRRRTTGKYLPTGALFGTLTLAGLTSVCAQTPAGTYTEQENDPPQSVSSAENSQSEPWPALVKEPHDLPPVPAKLQGVIEAGAVSFVFYDARQIQRRFQGETRLLLTYSLQSQFQWRLTKRSSGREVLVIRPHFEDIQLKAAHKILLPVHLAGEDFFADRLVQHELDHVRISIDPRYQSLFQKWLSEDLRVIRQQCQPGDDYDAVAQRAVDAEVDQRFQKILELIRIRYRELDRLTEHGAQATPAAFFEP